MNILIVNTVYILFMNYLHITQQHHMNRPFVKYILLSSLVNAESNSPGMPGNMSVINPYSISSRRRYMI